MLQLLSADLTAGITSTFAMLSYEVLIEKPCRTFPYHPTTLSAPFQVQLSNQAQALQIFTNTNKVSHLLLTVAYKSVKIQLAPLLPHSQCLNEGETALFYSWGSTKVHFSMVCLFLLISGKAHISTVHELCVPTVTAKCHKMSLCP